MTELEIVRKLTANRFRGSAELANPDGPEAAAIITELYEALACLLGRFCEIDAERGNDSEKQSEVIIARAALSRAKGQQRNGK